MINWLEPTADPHFPDTESVLEEPPGLLAAGGKLSIEWLVLAYRQGIFPWFNEGEPILWWAPAPRTVLYPKNFHASKSLHKLHRQQRYQVSENRDFRAVIEACAQDRSSQRGTWINSQMVEAYITMHQAGFAHSIECRDGEELVGGLKQLVDCGRYELIDCQLPTAHLHSLGAGEISRETFEAALNRWI